MKPMGVHLKLCLDRWIKAEGRPASMVKPFVCVCQELIRQGHGR